MQQTPAHRTPDRFLIVCATVLTAAAAPIWGYWNERINRQLVEAAVATKELELGTLDYLQQDLGWALFPMSTFCLVFAAMLTWDRFCPRWLSVRATRVVLIALMVSLGLAIAGWAHLALPVAMLPL